MDSPNPVKSNGQRRDPPVGEPPRVPVGHQLLDAGPRPGDVNVSLRKYRAHVADLMSRLGAATRFQAGMLAKERGWL